MATSALVALLVLCFRGETRELPRSDVSALTVSSPRAIELDSSAPAAKAPLAAGEPDAQPIAVAGLAQRALLPATPAPVATRRLSGVLVRADGSAAGGETVLLGALTHSARSELRTLTAADGRFVFALEPACDQALLTVKAREHARFQRWLDLRGPLKDRELGTLALASGGRVSGLVRFGAPFDTSGWLVSVFPRDTSLPPFVQKTSSGATRLDADGRFQLEHVPAGSVQLCLFHPLVSGSMDTELDVREGETSTAELVYGGPDPNTLLVVQVDFPLAAQQIWLRDERGAKLEPISIDTTHVNFGGLGPGLYELDVATGGHSPLVRAGLHAGRSVVVSLRSVGSD